MRCFVLLYLLLFIISCSQSPEYYLKRGNSFFASGDYYRAIDIYNRAIISRNDYSDAYVSRAMAYEKIGDKMKAVDDYLRAITYKSDHLAALNNLASLYIEMGYYDKALPYIEKTLEINPSYRYGYYNRGVVNYYRGLLSQAIEDFSKAIELCDDRMPLARYYRALSYYKLSMLKEAHSDLVSLMKRSDTNDVIYYTAAKVCVGLDPRLALDYIDRAIKIKEDAIYYYLRAVINEKLSRMVDAINDINTAIKLSNFSKSSYLYYAADIYIKLSRFDNAKEYCDMALSVDKNSETEYKKRMKIMNARKKGRNK